MGMGTGSGHVKDERRGYVRVETQRLLIRDVAAEDEMPFVEMAADGSLKDIGFDKNCSSWMSEWIDEAKEVAERDDPNVDYLAYSIILKSEKVVIGSVGCSYYEDLQETGITYFIGAKYRNNGYAVEAVKAYAEYFLGHYHVPKLIATVRADNVSSWKVLEKAGFVFVRERMYKDINDDREERYLFYERRV